MTSLIVAVTLVGCTVKESEDAEGDETYQIEPANIEVGTDTATVRVPDIDIVPDTTVDTTTSR
jgi:hypothetical protein